MLTATVDLAPRPGDPNPATERRPEAWKNRQADGVDPVATECEDLPRWADELVGLLVLAIAGAVALLAIGQF